MNAVPWEHGLGFTSMPSALVLAQSVKNGTDTQSMKFKSNQHQTHCTQRNTQPYDILFRVPRAALRFHTVLLTRRLTECLSAADVIHRQRIVDFQRQFAGFSSFSRFLSRFLSFFSRFLPFLSLLLSVV